MRRHLLTLVYVMVALRLDRIQCLQHVNQLDEMFLGNKNIKFSIDEVTVKTEANSLLQCGGICALSWIEASVVCNSFFYNRQSKQCYLQPKSRTESENNRGIQTYAVSKDWVYWENENVQDVSPTLLVSTGSEIVFIDWKTHKYYPTNPLPQVSAGPRVLAFAYDRIRPRLFWSTFDGLYVTTMNLKKMKINFHVSKKLTTDVAHNMAVDDKENILFYLVRKPSVKIMKMNLTSNKSEKFTDACPTKINMAIDIRQQIVFFSEAGSCKQKLVSYDRSQEEDFQIKDIDIIHVSSNDRTTQAFWYGTNRQTFEGCVIEFPQRPLDEYITRDIDCQVTTHDNMYLVGNYLIRSCITTGELYSNHLIHFTKYRVGRLQTENNVTVFMQLIE